VGDVRVEVDVQNTGDLILVEGGALRQDEVRSEHVRMVADSGAIMLALPQELVERLGLRERRKAVVVYADGRKEELPIAGPVTVRVGEREMVTECLVLPPNAEPLLGQIPLEAMDLLVDCSQQRLVPRPESPYLPLIALR